MDREQLHIGVEGAIIAALAMALEYVPHTVGPSAIEVSLGLVPLTLYALRRGFRPALLSGLIWGILDLVLRGFSTGGVLNPLQGFIEYPIAFAAVGCAGLAMPGLHRAIQAHDHRKMVGYSIWGAFLAVIVKYFFHFLAGAIYWGSYAPKGMNAWLYSLTINGGSAIVGFIMTAVIVVALVVTMPQLFMPKDTQNVAAI
ncbi:thiamine transporter family protein [Lactobacillus selangorensis]|uniref:Thiamine transporter family protein n=1 Tax=Lactobacillus selangorensis TaxID=81857 RepID=A0A0R2FVS0_9LACO|nr:energy-coupled thiamine transporter ThiT [Lactobacillus selangorensis]KRN29354.1 thiamine transporter family protein [Lactobacillus selangorensis]KRN34117.1 thiamine transporter family protein [Lactobacillus selangorensis]